METPIKDRIKLLARAAGAPEPNMTAAVSDDRRLRRSVTWLLREADQADEEQDAGGSPSGERRVPAPGGVAPGGVAILETEASRMAMSTAERIENAAIAAQARCEAARRALAQAEADVAEAEARTAAAGAAASAAAAMAAEAEACRDRAEEDRLRAEKVADMACLAADAACAREDAEIARERAACARAARAREERAALAVRLQAMRRGQLARRRAQVDRLRRERAARGAAAYVVERVRARGARRRAGVRATLSAVDAKLDTWADEDAPCHVDGFDDAEWLESIDAPRLLLRPLLGRAAAHGASRAVRGRYLRALGLLGSEQTVRALLADDEHWLDDLARALWAGMRALVRESEPVAREVAREIARSPRSPRKPGALTSPSDKLGRLEVLEARLEARMREENPGLKFPECVYYR